MKEVANTIIEDIENGVYENFDKLKSRLEYISQKMITSTHIESVRLTNGEINTLIENEYITSRYQLM